MVMVMVLVIFMVTAIVVTRVGMAVLHRGGVHIFIDEPEKTGGQGLAPDFNFSAHAYAT